jgi:hypothetical protein
MEDRHMSEDESEDPNQDPMFFSLLDEADRHAYMEMREMLRNSEKRYKRNKRLESLQDGLAAVSHFCVRHNSDDWKRFLVCGVCPMGQDIAINIRQLRLLMDKCKSSINGALSKMGYGTAPVKSAITASLVNYIPYLKGNFVEQRQWTVRRKVQLSPLPMRTTFPTPFVVPPRLSHTVTPDPPVPSQALLDLPGEVDELGLFGIPDLRKDIPSHPADDMGYNFLTDPCCCCPIHWMKDEENVDDFFTFS